MLSELRVMAREASGIPQNQMTLCHSDNGPPLQQTLHPKDEEEKERRNSVSVNTRGPVYDKYWVMNEDKEAETKLSVSTESDETWLWTYSE